MDALLTVLIAVDVCAAILCLKARAYTIGIALCAVAVPVCLVVTALMGAAASRQVASGTEPTAEFILLGAASLVTAALASGWALVVGAVRLRRRRRFPVPVRTSAPARTLY